MSLPSISRVLEEFGLAGTTPLAPEDSERVLVEAMRRDVPLAVDYLHRKAHDAEQNGSGGWAEDPNSPLGKQLIRVHASDALRPLAAKHFCHGLELTFVNCCGGIVDKTKKPLSQVFELQIRSQDGTIASPDC